MAQAKFKIQNLKFKMRWKSKIFFVLILFSLFFPQRIYAESDYVLPYPSFMPGSLFYKLNLIKEEILKYWYFGDFGQFTYNLKQSDKYLVEAKTLFEYKQYLLGYQALKNSDKYFQRALPYLLRAKNEGKDIIQKQNKLKAAALKHIEVLGLIKQQIPRQFVWRPEKSFPTILNLYNEVEKAIGIRKYVL